MPFLQPIQSKKIIIYLPTVDELKACYQPDHLLLPSHIHSYDKPFRVDFKEHVKDLVSPLKITLSILFPLIFSNCFQTTIYVFQGFFYLCCKKPYICKLPINPIQQHMSYCFEIHEEFSFLSFDLLYPSFNQLETCKNDACSNRLLKRAIDGTYHVFTKAFIASVLNDHIVVECTLTILRFSDLLYLIW